jgi:hypothetical protein
VEAFPHARSERSQVGDGGAGVVELVGRGDEANGGGGGAQVLEVRLLAGAPRRLGLDVGVRAGRDDGRDDRAEAATDGGEGLRSALVLDGVVEQGGDGLVLVGPVLEDQGRDGEEVRDVRRGGALAQLLRVEPGRVDQSLLEAVGQH